MKHRKTLQELTIKDNFMFGAVMCDEQNCKRFLEIALGFPIAKVEVAKEKCIVYHPQYKGVRLDVYAKDDKKTYYNVEMQAVKKPALFRRARYYHSQIDMELLLSGTSYSELPNSYVIFVCDFDPFGKQKYCYTIQNQCLELENKIVNDGNITIFLSTKGKNREEVPKELIKFLEYVSADLKDSTENFDDEFVASIQSSVESIKRSREMESRYMIFKEMLLDERREGKEEGKLEAMAESIVAFLEEIDTPTEELCKKIMEETDYVIMKRWLKLAVKAESIEQFMSEM